MDHNVSLITALATAFDFALILGVAAERLYLPALVGYLVAGILIGPATPGFVADIGTASQLSEVGVMLPIDLTSSASRRIVRSIPIDTNRPTPALASNDLCLLLFT